MSVWQRLQPRERRALLLAGAVLAVVLFGYGLWQPLQQAREQAWSRVQARQQALAWMEQAAARVAQLQGRSAHRFSDRGGQSLLTLLDQTARLQGLGGHIRRGEPAGERSVRLWLDGVLFDSLILWVERMEREYGIVVEEMSAESTGVPGQVNVRLSFLDTQASGD